MHVFRGKGTYESFVLPSDNFSQKQHEDRGPQMHLFQMLVKTLPRNLEHFTGDGILDPLKSHTVAMQQRVLSWMEVLGVMVFL